MGTYTCKCETSTCEHDVIYTIKIYPGAGKWTVCSNYLVHAAVKHTEKNTEVDKYEKGGGIHVHRLVIMT